MIRRKPPTAAVSEFPRAANPESDRSRLLSNGYLNLANAASAGKRARPELLNPFRFADVPPGVLPPEQQPLAQDANLKAAMGWAEGQRASRLAQDEQIIQFMPALGFANYGAALANGYGYLGYSFLSELAQVPEYRVITEVVAEECTREWIEIKSSTHRDKRNAPREKAEKIEKVEEAFDKLQIQTRMRQALEIDGLMGRGHLYLDTGETDDREELSQSIGDGADAISQRKINGEHPLLAVHAIEATWCYPNRYNSNDPLRADWYQPRSWFVMGKELHASRLLTLVGREVPDLLKPAYNFGGLSLSQMAKPYVDNWLRTRQAVADLIWSFSTNVLMTDLQTLLQGGVDADAILNRVRAFNALRTNQGTLVVNKDTEDWKNVSAPLSGLHELQAQSQEHMAAVSRIPLVKLLGIQPSGLNASSEGEIRVFYDSIHAYQEKLLRRPLTKILNFVQLSLFGEIDREITFDFKPLWQLDEVAQAGVQQSRATTRETDIAAGVISPEEGREAVADDPDSQYANLDLSEAEAPGSVPEEGDPNVDPSLDPDAESDLLGGPKPKSSRLAGEVTGSALRYADPPNAGFDVIAPIVRT